VARDALIVGVADPITSSYSALHRGRLARLSYLAPDIIAAIIEGRQPPSLNGRRLLRAASLPFDWQAQRRDLGFAIA
jgi:site-specific DNA recombinase